MKTTILLRRFLPYYRKYRAVLVTDLFCSSLTTACELVLPLIVRYITNTGMRDLASLTVRSIFMLGGLYLALRVIDAFANYYMANIGHVMGAQIETDMRGDLFNHVQRMNYSFFDNMKIGQIMARVTSDLFDVTEFSHHCPEEFFIAALKITAAFIILSTMDVGLTLIIFILLPFMFACTFYFNHRMRRAFKKSRHQIGEINARVEDSLLGVRVVKAFANEHLEEEKFEEGNEEFLNIKREQYRYMAGFQTMTRSFDGLMYLAVVVAGAVFMIRGRINPADFIAYLLYITTLLTTIRRIVEFTEQFQRGMTGVERFFEIMDAEPDITDAPGAEELTAVRGEVDFAEVSFHYNENEQDVLSNINMHVSPGEHVALVGSSGSGKTTLCNLIPRFYDVSAGAVRVDGGDVRTYTLHSLRSQIGVVQQDVYLFAGTVLENIAYGKLGAAREEVRAAAEQAGAHGFISTLPRGYDTYVGERGIRLSGGQKQRISIARAFLKNPPILILDEATSALDNESERLVQQSLEKLAQGRTTFTIAHRLTTIRNATVILVLTENGIEEQGNHEELMARRGVYYRLYCLSADMWAGS
ncbi:MAG: ABC transporter ATP-binding protein/permease [Syntrophomonadaceae bacterium]|nr:ABC transporter ATP-binding protein/permease [Syntrophomonadaceae bacterium]